ncbi:hypothetical protein GGR56DRAFT_238961 [Xylariaceae sp. FL0804]|nr:hypothetical protein GGR56DRAFT_238961 [Xylariaceae sp. FL0804]
MLGQNFKWRRDDDDDDTVASQPCPSGNGTEFGGEQSFQLWCDTALAGTLLSTQTADSVDACSELCTNHQNPRCDAVTWNPDNSCDLLSDVTVGTLNQTGVKSAKGLLPERDPEPTCADLGDGSTQTQRDKDFTMKCGMAYEGTDFDLLYQESFEGCQSTCAAHSLCVGVSYDMNMTQGFNNCHLKEAGSKLVASDIFDAAVLASSDDASSSSASTTATSAATTSTATATATVTSKPVSLSSTSGDSSSSSAAAASGAPGGGGPNIATIGMVVGIVIGGLLVITVVMGLYLWRSRRRRQREQRLQDAKNDIDNFPEMGISVSRTIDQYENWKVPSVTSDARGAGGKVDKDMNGLAQNRVGSALMDYLRAIGRR